MPEMTIANTEIHLWRINQLDFDLHEIQGSCLSWLTEPEKSRYYRYQFDRHRKQFLLGRILIRTALSRYDSAIEPANWRFIQNEYGKPAIHPQQQSKPLYFNLSHSGGRLVLAVACFPDIGVDVECSDKSRRLEAIAGRYFSSKECKSLLEMPKEQQQSRFYDLWTLKEAYIKACGLGLAIPLQHFSYSFSDIGKLAIEFDAQREDDIKAWRFWQPLIDADYKLALAARVNEPELEYNIVSWQMHSLDTVEAVETIIHRSS
jgi:4'-phosphopantetheinyl transferase